MDSNLNQFTSKLTASNAQTVNFKGVDIPIPRSNRLSSDNGWFGKDHPKYATHRVKRMAGHCFMWSRESANNGNVEVRMLDRKEDCEGIGDPRLDSIEGAIFIRDRYVYMYGDTWIDAVTLNKECVVCDAFVCGRLGGTFRIPAEVFDRLFGLKENFPEQYEKPVQEKNDLLEEAKRSVELCKNLLYSTKPMIEIAVGLIQDALIDIEDRMRDLDDMLYKLTQKEERREEK